MASLKEHGDDCQRFLGDRCEDVHRWLDAEFRRLGSYHRMKRHHRRGVEEAAEQFGERGRKAALIHILKDCGHIPKARDYVEEKVDAFGFRQKSHFNGYWDAFAFIEAVHGLIGPHE